MAINNNRRVRGVTLVLQVSAWTFVLILCESVIIIGIIVFYI